MRPLPSHRRTTVLREFLFGSAYYPEHWDAATRAEDASRMKAAGWNVVRMGEFAWALMEPEPGRFDFSLFDETIDRLGKEGIRTIFCTPTATPPRWLTLKYPEIMRVNAEEVAMEHGSRQQASLMHSIFREESRRITRVLAEHFKSNPNVIGWQLDNEIHCQISEDHSEASRLAFVEFLRKKYQNRIEDLNREWGTSFWSLTYPSFESILTPKANRPTYPNPSHLLDYYRFLSAAAAEFMRDQAKILREANALWWVTHNGCFKNLDYRGDLGEMLDFLGYDTYPMFTHDATERARGHAYNLDRVRAWSGNFLILEHQAGPGGQLDYFLDTPEPGEMRAMTYRSIAHGADGLLYFRWRSCRFGAEEYWTGILDHDNQPRRRYREAMQVGGELARLGQEILGTTVRMEVAVAAGEIENEMFHQALSLGLPVPGNVGWQIHGWFHRNHYAVGCVHPADDLSGVRLLFIPHWPLISEEWVSRLEVWVKAGGVLVIGARSGTHRMNGQVTSETLPGVFQKLAGVQVEEYGKQNHPASRPLDLKIGSQIVRSEHWYEELIPEVGTEVVGTWESRHLQKRPAICSRAQGKGRVIYVGTYLTEPVVASLMESLRETISLRPVASEIPEGVEVVVREGGGKRFWFVVNGETPLVWKTPPRGKDLLSGNSVGDSLALEAYGVSIIHSNDTF